MSAIYATTKFKNSVTRVRNIQPLLVFGFVYAFTYVLQVLQIRFSDFLAIAVFYLRAFTGIGLTLYLLIPRQSEKFALRRLLVALALLLLPLVLIQSVIMSRWLGSVSSWELIGYFSMIALPSIYYASLGSLIASVFGGKPIQWLALLLAPLLYLPVWIRRLFDLLTNTEVFLIEASSLLISIPALFLAAYYWRPQLAAAVKPVIDTLTREILRKELRLQKNNILFTVATFILGIIGLITVNAADPSVASFNVQDIRDALLSVILLPLLTLVLPLMIGSTAAAGEKAMGVQAWQTALPVSLRRIVALKFMVIIGLLLIISGVLPYIMNAVAIENITSVNDVYRYTWPLWLAILCAAIGYYSGTLARDDYQGLLISLGPIAVLILAMTYADPLRLVFPAYIGWQEPLMKEYLLAGRLLLIAAFFILSATQLQRRPGQKKVRLIATQAALLVIGTFILTLVNIVGERTALAQPNPRFDNFPGPHPRRELSVTIPQSLASLRELRPFGYRVPEQIQLITDYTLPYNAVAGAVIRRHSGVYNVADSSSHLFLAQPGTQLREFPQSVNGNLAGLSQNGHWIYALNKHNDKLLCGPLGLMIHSDYLPESWFLYVKDRLDVVDWHKDPNDFRQLKLRDGEMIIRSDTDSATVKPMRVNVYRSEGDGTTTTIAHADSEAQVMTVNGSRYIGLYCNTRGPVEVGNQLVATDLWLGSGALIVNVETGNEDLVPFVFAWNDQTSFDLLENFRQKQRDLISWRNSNFTTHPDGAIAASYNNLVGIIKPVNGSWHKYDVSYTTAIFPSGTFAPQIRFLTKDELIATDGQTVYRVQLPIKPVSSK